MFNFVNIDDCLAVYCEQKNGYCELLEQCLYLYESALPKQTVWSGLLLEC